MNIKKRSGKLEKFNKNAITKQTIDAHEGLGLDREVLEMSADIQFKDGMESKNLQQILINTARSLIDIDTPNYTFVAARLILNDLYHTTHRIYKKKRQSVDNIYEAISFSDYYDFNIDKLDWSKEIYDLDELNRHINIDGDRLFTDLGIDTLTKRYLMRKNGVVSELPQHMFMSIACFLAKQEKDPMTNALKFYDVMTSLEFLPATPTLSNGRVKNTSCFSCFVGTVEDDLKDIFRTYADQAQISKRGGGIGWDWTRIRALGGQIQDVKGAAGGTIPWLKIENDISIAVDQLGEYTPATIKIL